MTQSPTNHSIAHSLIFLTNSLIGATHAPTYRPTHPVGTDSCRGGQQDNFTYGDSLWSFQLNYNSDKTVRALAREYCAIPVLGVGGEGRPLCLCCFLFSIHHCSATSPCRLHPFPILQYISTFAEPGKETVEVIELKYGSLLPNIKHTYSVNVSWERPLFKHSPVEYYKYNMSFMTKRGAQARREEDRNVGSTLITVSSNNIVYSI